MDMENQIIMIRCDMERELAKQQTQYERLQMEMRHRTDDMQSQINELRLQLLAAAKLVNQNGESLVKAMTVLDHLLDREIDNLKHEAAKQEANRQIEALMSHKAGS